MRYFNVYKDLIHQFPSHYLDIDRPIYDGNNKSEIEASFS